MNEWIWGKRCCYAVKIVLGRSIALGLTLCNIVGVYSVKISNSMLRDRRQTASAQMKTNKVP